MNTVYPTMQRPVSGDHLVRGERYTISVKQVLFTGKESLGTELVDNKLDAPHTDIRSALTHASLCVHEVAAANPGKKYAGFVYDRYGQKAGCTPFILFR